jgi:hypothetical protein
LSEDQRRDEAELDLEFVTAAPAILGALLDGVVAGLNGLCSLATGSGLR